MVHSGDVEATDRHRPSAGMEAHRGSSALDQLSCVTDTSDGEQDDLPYDGDVGTACECNSNSDNLNDCTCIRSISDISNLSCSEDNKEAAAHYESPLQPEGVFDSDMDIMGTRGTAAEMLGSKASLTKALPAGGFRKPDGKEPLTHSKMSDVLLRHFSKGEPMSTWQLIECETIPEMSLTESIDGTRNKPENSEHKDPLTLEQQAARLEEHHFERADEVNTGGKNQDSLNKNEFVSNRSISSTAKCGCRQDDAQLIDEYEDACIFQNTKEQRDLFKKTVSSHELTHSQSEVHCCLPNCSEVTPEMKVPKMNENNKSIPTIERTSFPILLGESVKMNSNLEAKNYFDSAEVENQGEMRIPELLQHLEMQMQHADTKNHIDLLRFNHKIPPQSGFPNPRLLIYSGGTGASSEVFTANAPIPLQSTHGFSEQRLPCGTMASAFPATGMVEEQCLNPPHLLPKITQGEKMSQILKEQTDQLKLKVEDFSKHMTQDTFFLQDNYLALNQLKRYLDALERNYLAAREAHHNLQLQYSEKSINVGEFDPERKVEGEIFKLGMLLEDIQEQTDDSKCKLVPSLTSCESAHSSYSLWESSVVSSITDCPEENAFLHKNEEENPSQTTDVIPQENPRFSLEGEKCNLCLHTLQKRAESTSKREMEPLGKGCLLASKYSSSVMRSLSPKGKYEAEDLRSHTRDSLSRKRNANEESVKGNKNIQERRTGICSVFTPRKPTDLSDTNLSSDSEDILVYDSYHSQSDAFMKCESYKTFNTRLHRERKGFKCRCLRESRDQFKLRNCKEPVQSCALCRNKNYGSTSYSQKRIPSQKAQTNKHPPELVDKLPERQYFEADETRYSNMYQIILSHQRLPSKKYAQRKSTISIRNRNANDFNTNILSSTLDHAIQTANSLKKATERMVQAVSEDLAKVARKQL